MFRRTAARLRGAAARLRNRLVGRRALTAGAGRTGRAAY